MRPIVYFIALPSVALLTVIALSWAYHFGYIRGYRYMIDYIRKSKLQEAQDEFDQRVENAPVYRLGLDEFGYLRYQKKEGEKALPIFCKAIKGWCNRNCQFYKTAVYESDGVSSFKCWLNHQHYYTNHTEGPK